MPFVLTCDASRVGLGSALYQIHDSQPKPIAYYSRTFNKAEANYNTTHQELLSIRESVRHFAYYLQSIPELIIYTDHYPLIGMLKNKKLHGKVQRWISDICVYPVDLRYVKGRDNFVADYLSRNPLPENSNSAPSTDCPRELQATTDKGQDLPSPLPSNESALSKSKVLKSNTECIDNEVTCCSIFNTNIIRELLPPIQEIKKAQSNDPFCMKIRKNFDANNYLEKDGLLCKIITSRNTRQSSPIIRTVIPDTMLNRYLDYAHRHPSSSHPGVAKTFQKIANLAWMPALKQKVRRHVISCYECQLAKKSNSLQQYDPGICDVPDAPFKRINVDFIGPYVKCRGTGFRYALIIQCAYSKFIEIIPMTSTRASDTVSMLFFHFLCRHGNVKEIVSDHGSQFESAVFKRFLKDMQITHIQSSVYSPRSNICERANLTIKTMLRTLVPFNQNSWDLFLPLVQFAFNSLPNSDTSLSPSEIAHKRPLFMCGFEHSKNALQDIEQKILNMTRDFNKIPNIYKKHRLRNAERIKKRYARVTFAPGDLVKVRRHQKSSKVDKISRKLLPLWKGPFTILRQLNDQAFLLVNEFGKQEKCHVLHMYRYHANIDDLQAASKSSKQVETSEVQTQTCSIPFNENNVQTDNHQLNNNPTSNLDQPSCSFW